jgi:hypothetical protein
MQGCAAGDGASPTPMPSPTPSAEPSAPDEGQPRFLITCFYPDGTEVATFTSLEEAWASTNYVRIDTCEAAVAGTTDVELTAEEQGVADVAAADLPGEDPTVLYAETLAACVRLNPAELTATPTSILEATGMLCPEAPQAGVIAAEVAARPPAD